MQPFTVVFPTVPESSSVYHYAWQYDDEYHTACGLWVPRWGCSPAPLERPLCRFCKRVTAGRGETA